MKQSIDGMNLNMIKGHSFLVSIILYNLISIVFKYIFLPLGRIPFSENSLVILKILTLYIGFEIKKSLPF